MVAKRSQPEPKIQEKDVRGLKYFDQLAPLLERLHDCGRKRDTAGNRSLHFDQYCMLILLFFFNPVVKSLRGLQQAGELKNVQKKLGCPRTSLGSPSESVSIFDPERLKEIIAELAEQLQPLGRDPRLKDVRDTVTLVDSTLISILPHLTEASLKPTNTSGLVQWRLHTHFEVDRHVPRRMDVTPDEIFFRFLKQILGCRHLLSGSRNGIEIQTYCAIIACLLISLLTAKKPTLRTYEMLCWYFIGVADLDELPAHIEKLKKHDAK